MVKIVMYVGLCLSLFGAGLGLAVALGVPQQPTEADESVEMIEEETDLASIVPGDPTAEFKTPEGADVTVLPVPVRGERLSVEELFRFGAMYREQQQLLLRREDELQRRQSRLKLIRDDVDGSRREFDGLRAQVDDTATRVKKAFSDLETEQQDFDQEKVSAESELQKLEEARNDANEEETVNLRRISSWFQSMPAEKAAEYIRELSNEGKMESAVKLLGNIEERTVAKILSAMDDAALVVELTEAFRRAKRPVPKTARR